MEKYCTILTEKFSCIRKSLLILYYTIFNFFPTALVNALKYLWYCRRIFQLKKNLLKFISQTKIRRVQLWWTMVIVYRQCANNTLFPYIQLLPGTVWNVLVREAMKRKENTIQNDQNPTNKKLPRFQQALSNNTKIIFFPLCPSVACCFHISPWCCNLLLVLQLTAEWLFPIFCSPLSLQSSDKVHLNCN